MANLILNDHYKQVDKLIAMPELHRSGIYQHTKIMGGYGLRRDRNGVSSLGLTTFTEENMIPIGGSQYAFEQLFGVPGSLHVPTLYEVSDGTIGLPDVSINDYRNSGEDVGYYIPAANGDPNTKILFILMVSMYVFSVSVLQVPQ